MRRPLGAFALVAAAALIASAGCDEERTDDEVEQCPIHCAISTGFPCPCDPIDGCYDDSVCGLIEPDDPHGACFRPCESDADCAVDIDCAATPRCMMTSIATGEMHCGYACEIDEDCPENMICVGSDDGSICYPDL